jgi:hypothetical protein
MGTHYARLEKVIYIFYLIHWSQPREFLPRWGPNLRRIVLENTSKRTSLDFWKLSPPKIEQLLIRRVVEESKQELIRLAQTGGLVNLRHLAWCVHNDAPELTVLAQHVTTLKTLEITLSVGNSSLLHCISQLCLASKPNLEHLELHLLPSDPSRVLLPLFNFIDSAIYTDPQALSELTMSTFGLPSHSVVLSAPQQYRPDELSFQNVSLWVGTLPKHPSIEPLRSHWKNDRAQPLTAEDLHYCVQFCEIHKMFNDKAALRWLLKRLHAACLAQDSTNTSSRKLLLKALVTIILEFSDLIRDGSNPFVQRKAFESLKVLKEWINRDPALVSIFPQALNFYEIQLILKTLLADTRWASRSNFDPNTVALAANYRRPIAFFGAYHAYRSIIHRLLLLPKFNPICFDSGRSLLETVAAIPRQVAGTTFQLLYDAIIKLPGGKEHIDSSKLDPVVEETE